MKPWKAHFVADSVLSFPPEAARRNGCAAARDAVYQSPFQSFWMGGFESSTHYRRDGVRLDMIAATQHDVFARHDYARLRDAGLLTARDAVRWHRVEVAPGRYDWSSVCGQIRAAHENGVQVIWDLMHYGWPDEIDIFSGDFVVRFARFSAAFARLLRDEGQTSPLLCPVNEISFFAWAGGEVAYINPCSCGRGHDLKAQLVRAAIAAMDEVWRISPNARFVHTDPLINIVPDPSRPEDGAEAEAMRLAQFESWDMISGRVCPELGGAPEYLDILGINYYVHNQRIYPGGPGTMIEPSHPLHRPLRELLHEIYAHYRRPLFIAETGIEDDARPSWLRYVANEAQVARLTGVPLHGLCLYPIANHPGWDDERHCHNGLWDYPDDAGNREIFEPLWHELRLQMQTWQKPLDFSQTSRGMDAGILDAAAQKMQAAEPEIEAYCLAPETSV